MHDGVGACRPWQLPEDECAARPTSAAVAGGIRRLRDELNAALLDQRRQHVAFLQQYTHCKGNTGPPTSTREQFVEPAPESRSLSSAAQVKTPAWSDLDAALGSLKFQSCATALGHANHDKRGKPDAERELVRDRHGRQRQYPTRTSRIAIPDQIVECARREKRPPHAEPEARLEISRKYLELWRTLSHVTMVARQLSRRAASHHRDSLSRHAFHAWRLYCRDQQCLHRACCTVALRSNRALIGGVYRRWRHALRFQRTHRALQASRRKQLLRTVLYNWQSHTRFRRRLSQLRGRSQDRTARTAWQRWQQYIYHRHQRVSRNAIAQSHFLQWQWKKLIRQVQHCIERRHIIEQHFKTRWRRMLEAYFDGWIEFIERKKRWQLATQWYHERLLETALDNWKSARDRAQYVKTLEKRAHKKMCRYRLRRCLQQWVRAARYLRQRAAQLKQISTRILVRRAFGKLCQFNLALLKRERCLQAWKFRYALRTWLRRANEQRKTALQEVAVARNHSTFIKRTFGWHPWRLAYQRSSRTNALNIRRHQRELRRAWNALKTAAAEQHRRRSIMTLTSDRVVFHRLEHAVSTWADYAHASQTRRQRIQQSSAFHDTAVKRKSFTAWRHWLMDSRQQKVMDAEANGHILKRALLQWRDRANQLRRKRLAALTKADNIWVTSLERKCIFAWWSYTLQQQSRLCRWVFVSWCRYVRLKKVQRALMAVARSMELYRRWHRWRELVRYNVELNQRGKLLSAKHERYTKHAFFVEKWLSKARRYHCARLLISALDRKATWQRSLSQWKLWYVHQQKKRRATKFHKRSLQLRYLNELRAATVGRAQLSDRHCRHRRLSQAWAAWLVLLDRSKLGAVVDNHFRQFRLSRALIYLQANGSRTKMRRAYQRRADLWRRAVILQTGFGHWYFTTQKLIRLRRAQEQVQWHCMGARHFRTWRFMRAMQHKIRAADTFRRQVMLKRGFNLWLQITKRRLVAVAMWRYTMARIRSAHALAAWKTHTVDRRRVGLGIEVLRRRRHVRILQGCFSQWELMVAVEVFRSICLSRCAVRWVSHCLTHWKRFRMIKRMCHERRSKMMGSSFVRLRRFAIRQKAGELLYQQSARVAINRALRVWRVELRLVRVQRAASRTLLQQCMHDWARHVAGCRQQREWIRYIQRLHQIHESKDEGSGAEAQWQVPILAPRQDRIEHQDLQKRVLHAWYLAAKNSQRRRHRDLISLSSVPIASATPMKRPTIRNRIRSSTMPAKDRRRAHDASNRVLALRFWSDHLVSRTFCAWKNRSQSKRLLYQRVDEFA